MTRVHATGSLRLRLLLGTLAWVLLAVLATGWGLRALFKDHITQQLQEKLALQLDELSGSIDWLNDGSVDDPTQGHVRVGALSDVRLAQPLSGLYWQIDRLGNPPQRALARSRSLWDQTLALPPLPDEPPARGYRVLQLHDAQGHPLLALARTLDLPEDAAPRLRLVVAGDEALLAEPLQRFTRLLGLALAVLTLGLVLAVALQLQLALRPFTQLRLGLAALRAGKTERVEGRFPQELEPLVDELNHVLAQNADMVQRARTQAGNLAHAVNTPLAILANAAAAEHGPLAQLVGEQVASARRQVDYHLARARSAAAVRASGLATPVREPITSLLRTMARLHAARAIAFDCAPDLPDAAFRGEAQDLYELLGNLIDNAGKHARTRVVVGWRVEGQGEEARLRLTIDDDGPGIPEAERTRMFERGVQLDERAVGSGLGLDIVRTLAENYGGCVQAGASPLGGARMVLELPAAG